MLRQQYTILTCIFDDLKKQLAVLKARSQHGHHYHYNDNVAFEYLLNGVTNGNVNDLKYFIYDLNCTIQNSTHESLKSDLLPIRNHLVATLSRKNILGENELMVAVKEYPDKVWSILEVAMMLFHFNKAILIDMLSETIIPHGNALMIAAPYHCVAVRDILEAAIRMPKKAGRSALLTTILSEETSEGMNALLLAAMFNYKAVAFVLRGVSVIEDQGIRENIFARVLTRVDKLRQLSGNHYTQLLYDFYQYHRNHPSEKEVQTLLTVLLSFVSREKILDDIAMSKSIQCSHKIELLEAILDEDNVLGRRFKSTANAGFKPGWYQEIQARLIASKASEYLTKLRKLEVASNADEDFILVESDAVTSETESSLPNTSEPASLLAVGCSTDGFDEFEAFVDFSLFAYGQNRSATDAQLTMGGHNLNSREPL